MVEKSNNCIKVTLEFEHETYIAEGEDAQNWHGWVTFCDYLTVVHGHARGFKWTRIEKKEVEHEEGNSQDR